MEIKFDEGLPLYGLQSWGCHFAV